MSDDFRLHTNSFGQLTFTAPDGTEHANVEAVRAFPITAPDEGLSLLDKEGHELAWIPALNQLDDERRAQVLNLLRTREFMPQIQRITSVSSYRTPSTWEIETDRGPTQFILNAEDDIRRLAEPSLLIAASRGIQFLIRDPRALDTVSRKILDHFL
jgi:hypothetical protein